MRLCFPLAARWSLTRIDAGLGVAVFSSLAPIFREGGHSQGTDSLGPSSGAFFARLRAAFARADTAESRIARADPMAIYAAFTADLSRRMRAAPTLAAAHPDVAEFLCRERAWLASSLPDSVVAGDGLLASLSLP